MPVTPEHDIGELHCPSAMGSPSATLACNQKNASTVTCTLLDVKGRARFMEIYTLNKGACI